MLGLKLLCNKKVVCFIANTAENKKADPRVQIYALKYT